MTEQVWPFHEDPDEKADPKDPYPQVIKSIKGKPGKVYEVYLSDTIDIYKEIKQIQMLLRDMNKDDEVVVYLSGYGGSVQLGMELINAMDDCKGHIKGDVVGMVYSMHALLASYIKDLKVRDGADFMFHDMSLGARGKLSEVREQLEHHKKWGRKIFEKCTRGLITASEINTLLDGKDLYLDAEEMRKRIDKLNKKESEDLDLKPTLLKGGKK